MAVKIENSLSKILEKTLENESETLRLLQAIKNGMEGTHDYITVGEGEDRYRIPSFYYLKRSIDRLDNTLNQITNVGNTSNSRIQLSDGSYRNITTSNIPSEAPDIKNVKSIDNFKIKSNWFFEDMLNPCLYVTLDLEDSKLDPQTERVVVRRYILNIDTDEKNDFFKSLMNNSGSIKFEDFKQNVVNNNIRYMFDEDIRYLPPRYKKYSGVFTIQDYRYDVDDYDVDTHMSFRLDSLNYSVLDSSMTNSQTLKENDILEPFDSPVTARFKITKIDGNWVTLELIEGITGLIVGDELKLGSVSGVGDNKTPMSVDIPVGFDEREVIFIKSIDPISNIPSNEWSPGIAFYSNELTYTKSDGSTTNLGEFYQNHVVDFGQVILSYAKDYYPSIREAIIPNAPVLYESNFVVEQVNNSISQSVVDELNTLSSNKVTVLSEIQNNTGKKKEKKIDEYNDICEQIQTLSNTISTDTTPIYVLSGMWEFPKAKVSRQAGVQEVIGFKINYQYVKGNEPHDHTTIPLTTSDGTTVEGVVSNWIEYTSNFRRRVLDKKTGEYVWEQIDITNGDEIKPNELRIPVSKGDVIKIRIKSISEAGWPSNPVESDEWSNEIEIHVDEYLDTNLNNINSIIEKNKMDIAISNYMNYVK